MDEIRTQIAQMRAALLVADDTDKPAIQCVINQLEELLESFEAPSSGEIASTEKITEDDEYAKFMAEISELPTESPTNADIQSSNSNETSHEERDTELSKESVNIDEEVSQLEGMKCMAPHEENWGQIGYYPAMISQVLPQNESENEESTATLPQLLVRVVFIQPVARSQLLCPFYQQDKCRYSDDKCKFSHGEVVPLENLREYKEPNYEDVVASSRVLAKRPNNLWFKATVTEVLSGGIVKLSFDGDEELNEVELHETVPLEESSSSEDSSDDSELDQASDEEIVNSDVLLRVSANVALGEWEQHTKGIGSRIMLKMGYVMGSGLGKEAEGRVMPVDASIVPQGMSLDYWMELKERHKGGNQGLTVEKRIKKAKNAHAMKEARLEAHKKSNVFDFLNNKLSKNYVPKPISKTSSNVVKQTSTDLKKNMLVLGDELKKVNKDILKINQSIKRLEGRDDATVESMKAKLQELLEKKNELSSREKKIMGEQKSRHDKRKLLEF